MFNTLHHASNLLLHLPGDGRELLLDRGQLFLEYTLLLNFGRLLGRSGAIDLEMEIII